VKRTSAIKSYADAKPHSYSSFVMMLKILESRVSNAMKDYGQNVAKACFLVIVLHILLLFFNPRKQCWVCSIHHWKVCPLYPSRCGGNV